MSNLQKGDKLSCESGQYLIEDFIGEGTFGKVAKCLNLKNQEIVAIKIYKGEISKGAIQHEVAMLNELRALDPDKNNLVKFIDSFDCQNDYCVVFEMLNKSLWDLMVERGWWPLTLNEIRPIAQQLLVALNALNGLGIIHGDVKADNVMFVSHQDQPSRVKLIDFGLAFSASRAEVGMLMQARTFRAPEVFLGLPISEAIDMWGLGCIMALLYIACNLFPGHTAHQTMNSICQMLGQPMDHLLSAGTKTSRYFVRTGCLENPQWRLMTKTEYLHAKSTSEDFNRENDDDSEDDDNFDELYAQYYKHLNLDGVVKANPKMDDLEYADRMDFIEFLKGVLHLDSEQRLTPSQGLQHNFITVAHLKDHSNTSYVEEARNFMTVCTNVNEHSFTESSNEHRFSENVNTAKLSCKSGQYVIESFIGEGGYGKVAKCLNLKNQETVAIKIYKSDISKDVIQHEVTMLKELKALDPDKNNLVKFIDSFDCQNDYCVVFEMLDKSLWNLIVERGWRPLTLNEIRPIAQQLLVALNALKGLGIIHGDVKADNAMFVNHKDEPFRVKLIDFGLALPASRAEVGMLMQARVFRAPEVFLGLPISEAIDMWGLGCIMALLYFANCPFDGHTAHQTMKAICQLLGQPMDHLLNAGTKTSHYFVKTGCLKNPQWRLMTKNEYLHAKSTSEDFNREKDDDSEDDDDSEELFAEKCGPLNLDGIVKANPKMDALEYADRMEFLDFLKGVLHLDSEQRLTPSQGLQHNFITMAHLKDHCNTSYVEQARNFMTVCTNVNDLHETADCLSNSKKDSFTESSNEHRFSENVNTERFSHETIHAEKSGESVRQLNLTRNLEPDAECPSSCSNSIFSRGQEWDAQEILQDYMHLFTCYKDNVSAWTELESDSNSVMITESEWDAQKILQDYMDLLSAYKDEVSAWTKLESDSNHVMFSGENWAAQEISQDHSMHLSSLHHNEVSIPGMFTESDRDAQEILQDYMDLFTCCMSEVSAWNELESESNRGMLSGEN